VVVVVVVEDGLIQSETTARALGLKTSPISSSSSACNRFLFFDDMRKTASVVEV